MVTKKQKEKRKDFQKQKLKVGKGTPANANATDTSFTAKSIHLKQQNIANELSSEAELQKYLSLCKHHSNTVRKEALIYIQNHIDNIKSMKDVISTIAPMVRDESNSVREQLLETLKAIDNVDNKLIKPHTSLIMLHTHSAMTYLTPNIRAQSTNFLNFMLQAAPEEVSRLSFAKTLSCFFPLLGWETDEKSSKLDRSISLAASTATTGLSYGSKASSTKLSHIQSLEKLLTAALSSEEVINESKFFHPDSKKFLLPTTSGPFLHLELFVPADDKVTITEDTTDRIALVKTVFNTLENGLKEAIKDGGQVGRTASKLLEFIVNILNK